MKAFLFGGTFTFIIGEGLAGGDVALASSSKDVFHFSG